MSSIKEGVQVLVFFIGLLLIIGTIGVIEMNEQPDYIMVAGQTFLGFLLMWIGAKGVNKIEWRQHTRYVKSNEQNEKGNGIIKY